MKFTVPGQPIAKGRHRTAILKVCRKCGKKTCMRICRCGSEDMTMLTTLESPDPDSARYENKVALFARQAMMVPGATNNGSLMEGPIEVLIVAYALIPESRACKKYGHIPRMEGATCKRVHEGDYNPHKPDFDNVQKAVCDGMNQVVYRDDSQVCHADIWTYYSSVPRVEVEVKQL